MNFTIKRLSLIGINCLLFSLFSCSINKPEFGKSIIEKDTNTVALQKLKAEIRNIPNTIFETASYKGNENIEIKYRLLKPKKNNSSQKFPLVIVFHGSGAIGTDNESQMGLLAKLWALPHIQKKYPAYVVAPQFPVRSSNYVMDKNRGVLVSVPQAPLQAVLQLIDSLKQSLNIDEKRIYVIGYSMGASTVINALSARPDLFAAAVSISGIPQFDSVAILANKPIWLIHGNQDRENPFESDVQFFKEVSSKNKTLFWEMDSKSHNDIFSTNILGKKIPNWLFGFKK